MTADGSAKFAALQFSLVGNEPFGFAIDNLRFGKAGKDIVLGIPESDTDAFMSPDSPRCTYGARIDDSYPQHFNGACLIAR